MLHFFRSLALRPRLLTWSVNGVLIALCAASTARIANAWVELWLSGMEPPPPPTALAPAVRSSTWAEREAILAKELFRVAAPEVESAPPPDPEPVEELEETALPYRLLGTAASSRPSDALAAIQDQRSQAVLILHPGDELEKDGGPVLVRIERRRIVIDNEGRHEALSLDDGSEIALETLRAGSPAAEPVASPPLQLTPFSPTTSPEGTAPMPPDLTPSTQLESWGNPDPASSENSSDGPTAGVSVSQVFSGIPMPIADLREGDTIVAINGIELNGAESQSALLEALTLPGPSELVVVGADGQRRTLRLPSLPELYE